MAEKLFISVTTVDTHRNNLLSKFNVKNTANLIRMATQFDFVQVYNVKPEKDAGIIIFCMKDMGYATLPPP